MDNIKVTLRRTINSELLLDINMKNSVIALTVPEAIKLIQKIEEKL